MKHYLDKMPINKELIKEYGFEKFKLLVDGWVESGTLYKPDDKLVKKTFEELTGEKILDVQKIKEKTLKEN